MGIFSLRAGQAGLGDQAGEPGSPLPLSSSPRLQAESLAARMPAMVLAAERVAATVAHGAHGRRRPGGGESFWQYRPYQAGDPPARIDWRQAGRSDALLIRQQEWDAAQTLWIWRDGSPSMAWSSWPGHYPEKQERAEVLALALTLLLLRGGERVATLEPPLPPQHGVAALERVALALLATPTQGCPPPQGVARHGAVALLGDWLDPPETLGQRLAQWQKQEIRGCLVQIRDPAESDLPYDGRVRFQGAEGETAVTIPEVPAVRAAYRQRLAAHDDALATLCRMAGWGLIRHRTDQPPQAALLTLYQALTRGSGAGAPACGRG